MNHSTPRSSLPRRRRLPPWLRHRLPQDPAFAQTAALLKELGVHTVCASARCPNRWECWERRTATFMIAGDRCTRACRFCAVTTARPEPLDPSEPERVAEAAGRLRLRHVVITSVARDDLPDGGAEHFRKTILAVKRRLPGAVVEALTPDFQGDPEAVACVLSAGLEIFNHNLETIRRLTPRVRSKAAYERSLRTLRIAKKLGGEGLHVKSGLMLGLGETEEEVREAIDDLREAGCNLLTLGQYLQPTPRHLPVAEYVPPNQFDRLAAYARAKGFAFVAAGPLVRSSYHADAFNPRQSAQAPKP